MLILSYLQNQYLPTTHNVGNYFNIKSLHSIKDFKGFFFQFTPPPKKKEQQIQLVYQLDNQKTVRNNTCNKLMLKQ